MRGQVLLKKLLLHIRNGNKWNVRPINSSEKFFSVIYNSIEEFRTLNDNDGIIIQPESDNDVISEINDEDSENTNTFDSDDSFIAEAGNTPISSAISDTDL